MARRISRGQILAIGRALMTNPALLLLDEPLEGLAPIVAQELVRVIRALRADAGMAIVVVEQHARVALSLTEHAIVLDRGRIVHRGESRGLLDAPGTLHRLLLGNPDAVGADGAAAGGHGRRR